MKIKVNTDCGNSPRKNFLKNFNIAFAKGETEYLIKHVSENIYWEIVGDKTINGLSEFKTALEGMKDYIAEQIEILNIITHGKEAAVHGILTFSGNQKMKFCDICIFKGHKGEVIEKLTSFTFDITGK